MAGPSYAFFSGAYATWNRGKRVGAPKYVKGVRFPGLGQALKDPNTIASAIVTANGRRYRDWYEENDLVMFTHPLPRGEYQIEIQITYNYLEPVVYR
jgi:hypothetical protein